MLLFDKILLGPFRIFLLFAGVLLAHQIIIRQPLTRYGLDYIMKRTIFFGSLLMLTIFSLVQLNMYDIFSILSVFLIGLIVWYFGFGSMKRIPDGLQAKKRRFLLSFFRFMEKKVRLRTLIRRNRNFFFTRKVSFVLLVATITSLCTFASRYLFLKNDLYTLSSLWIKNLELVKSFNSNSWFGTTNGLVGELALINFYAKITGISEEMAMHSFGLLEGFGLSIVLYWIILKLTKDAFIAPMISVLFFALFYRYMPINVNLLLEHNSLYLALGFALPVLLFSALPEQVKSKRMPYILLLTIGYIAVAFTNLFVALILVPLFLGVALVFSSKVLLPYRFKSLIAYAIGTGFVLGVYGIGCYVNEKSFLDFLRSSLILVNSYTYFPQLIVVPEKLVLCYLAFCFVVLAMVIPLWNRKRERWGAAQVFLIFTMLFLTLRYFQFTWVDIDMYYESLSPLMVIVLGIFLGAGQQYWNLKIPEDNYLKGITLAFIFLATVGFGYATNGFFQYDYREIDELKADILKVYDDLSSKNMPYSYAIVNQQYGQFLSTNEHHFINYNVFLNNYPERDSVYQIKKEDKRFLAENPDYILPQSVFVFITKTDPSESKYHLATPTKTAFNVKRQLDLLEEKGREIAIFYEDEYLAVYEIVNKKNASNLNDLIFNL